MKNTLTLEWLKAAVIRALKTFAQTMISMVTIGAAISEVDWKSAISVSAVAALLSILTSIAGLPEVGSDGELLIDTTGEKDIYRFEVEDFDDLADKDRVVLKVNHDAKLESLSQE